ncbi:unnamed protein product [Brassica oleracea]
MSLLLVRNYTSRDRIRVDQSSNSCYGVIHIHDTLLIFFFLFFHVHKYIHSNSHSSFFSS